MTHQKASQSRLYTDTPDTPKRRILRDTGNTDTPILRNPDTPETTDTPDSLALESVFTVEKAIALSAPTHPQPLFRYSRCLRKVELDSDRRFSESELEDLFTQWWDQYKPDGEHRHHWFADFINVFKRTRIPLGENPFTEALRKADIQGSSKSSSQPEDIQRLLRVCAELQKSAGDFTFFISVRQAAEVLGLQTKLHTANAILAKLVSDGVLRLVKRGTRHKASEYRLP